MGSAKAFPEKDRVCKGTMYIYIIYMENLTVIKI
jgi:hypothetical protein